LLPRFACLLVLHLLIGVVPLVAGGDARADETGLTPEFMNDPANIEQGKTLFQKQCAGCHGRNAYPGKAPKLKPKKLSPEDVYLRITYGFRKMPAWEDLYTDEERMAITAYVKSRRFSN
jgi:mono/diheme cytochrome c family protein